MYKNHFPNQLITTILHALGPNLHASGMRVHLNVSPMTHMEQRLPIGMHRKKTIDHFIMPPSCTLITFSNLFRTLGDKLGEAKASGNLGNTLKVLGKFSEATACCERHLDISRELADKVSFEVFLLIHCLLNETKFVKLNRVACSKCEWSKKKILSVCNEHCTWYASFFRLVKPERYITWVTCIMPWANMLVAPHTKIRGSSLPRWKPRYRRQRNTMSKCQIICKGW